MDVKQSNLSPGFPSEINVSVVAFQNNMKICERELCAAIVFALVRPRGEHKVGGFGEFFLT